MKLENVPRWDTIVFSGVKRTFGEAKIYYI